MIITEELWRRVCIRTLRKRDPLSSYTSMEFMYLAMWIIPKATGMRNAEQQFMDILTLASRKRIRMVPPWKFTILIIMTRTTLILVELQITPILHKRCRENRQILRDSRMACLRDGRALCWEEVQRTS